MKEFNLIDSNPETILADALRFHEFMYFYIRI